VVSKIHVNIYITYEFHKFDKNVKRYLYKVPSPKMSELFKLHKKFELVLHEIKIILFNIYIMLTHRFLLFIEITKIKMFLIVSLSDIGTGDNIFLRLEYTDFLLLLNVRLISNIT